MQRCNDPQNGSFVFGTSNLKIVYFRQFLYATITFYHGHYISRGDLCFAEFLLQADGLHWQRVLLNWDERRLFYYGRSCQVGPENRSPSPVFK